MDTFSSYFYILILSLSQVVGTCFVRKAMDKLFTQYELQYLDDIMPGEDKNAKEDELKKHDGDVCPSCHT